MLLQVRSICLIKRLEAMTENLDSVPLPEGLFLFIRECKIKCASFCNR